MLQIVGWVMLKKVWSILFIILIVSTSCKRSEVEIAQIAKSEYDSIPRFDSIDWVKAYNFRKPNSKIKKEKQRFLNNYYKNFWLKNNTSGGVIVAQHGEILFEGYSGFSDFENEVPITKETPIHIASISKVLTSMAVLKLVENQKLALTDVVDKFFKDFPYEGVKVQDLLNHRSGLPNYLPLSEDPNYWDKSKMMSNHDLLEMFIEKKPDPLAKPDTSFFYNNTNYVILALIIEKVTGFDYPQAMKYIVFDPLGMENTFVMEFDKHSDQVSKTYYKNGRIWDYDHLDKTYGDKNIYSTPRDLLKMDIAMYSDKFLPQHLKEKAWQGYSYERPGVKNYGLGFRLMEWDDENRLIYHNGKWHGNNTTYVRDIENEATIIALGNRLNPTIYASMKLVSLFGDYPYRFDDGKIRDVSIRNLQRELNLIKENKRNS